MKKVLYPELMAEMAKRGETRTEIAKVLGLNVCSVSKKLRGITQWTISEVEKLCAYYNKDFYELFKKND